MALLDLEQDETKQPPNGGCFAFRGKGRELLVEEWDLTLDPVPNGGTEERTSNECKDK